MGEKLNKKKKVEREISGLTGAESGRDDDEDTKIAEEASLPMPPLSHDYTKLELPGLGGGLDRKGAEKYS